MDLKQKEIKVLLGALVVVLLAVVIGSIFSDQRGEAVAQRRAVEYALNQQIEHMDPEVERTFIRDMSIASLEIVTQTGDELEVEVMIEMFDLLKFFEEIHLLLIEGDFWDADHLVEEVQIAWNKALLSTEPTQKVLDQTLHLQKDENDQWSVLNPEVFTFHFPEKESFSYQTARKLHGFKETYERPFKEFNPRFFSEALEDDLHGFMEDLRENLDNYENRRIDLTRIGSRREIQFVAKEPDLEEFWTRFFELSRASIKENGYREDFLVEAFQRAREITNSHDRYVMDIIIMEERGTSGAIRYSTEVVYHDGVFDASVLLEEFRRLKELLPTMLGESGEYQVNLSSNVFTDRTYDLLPTNEIRSVHHFSLENGKIYLMEDDGKILRFHLGDIEGGDWTRSMILAAAPDDEELMVGNPQMVITDDLVILQYLVQTEGQELQNHLNVFMIDENGVEELFRTDNYPMNGQPFWFSYNNKPYAVITYHHEIVRDPGIGPNRGGVVDGEVVLYDLLNDEVLYRLNTEDFIEEGRIKFSQTNDQQSIVFFYDQQDLLIGEENQGLFGGEIDVDLIDHFIEVYNLESERVVLSSEDFYFQNSITYGAVPLGENHMVFLTMDEGWHLWNLANGVGKRIPYSDHERIQDIGSYNREIVRDMKEVKKGFVEAWIVSELYGGVKEYWIFDDNGIRHAESIEKSLEGDSRYHPLSHTMTFIQADEDEGLIEVYRMDDPVNEQFTLENVKTYVVSPLYPIFLFGQHELYNGIQMDLSPKGHGVLAKADEGNHGNLFYLFRFIRAEEGIATELGGFLRLEVTEDLERVVIVYKDGVRIYQLGELFRRIEGFFR